MKWISVKDRLPPNKDRYLCAGVEAVGGRLHKAHVRILKLYYTWVSDWEDAENFVVTHWMPLPEPPKEEE